MVGRGDICILVPKRNVDVDIGDVFTYFRRSTIFLMVFIILFFIIITRILRKIRARYTKNTEWLHIFPHIFGQFLLQTPRIIPRNWTAHILFTTWTIYAFLCQSIYNALHSKDLLISTELPDMNTLKVLVDSDLTTLSLNRHFTLLITHYMADEKLKPLSKRLRIISVKEFYNMTLEET